MFLFDRLKTSPAQLKVASELSDQNPVGTLLFAIISVLNANFYENINAHY